jgi:hypothetical protein
MSNIQKLFSTAMVVGALMLIPGNNVQTSTKYLTYTKEWNLGAVVPPTGVSSVFNPAWTNTQGRSLDLVGFNVWVGYGFNGVADIVVKAAQISSGIFFLEHHADRYANPSGVELGIQMLPLPLKFAVGDGIAVFAVNAPFGVGTPSHAHPIIVFYFGDS